MQQQEGRGRSHRVVPMAVERTATAVHHVGWNHDVWGLVALLAVASFFFLYPVDMPLTDGDTAFYAKIALNILDSGDWQTLKFKGWQIVDKPPLTIWPIAVSIHFFGRHDWAVRLWHSLIAIGTVWAVYALARFWYGSRVAFWAGAVLVSTMLFIYMGLVPQQDIPALFFFTLTFYGASRFLYRGEVAYAYLAWVSIGLAVLTRALHGIVFPVGVLTLYVVLHRRSLGPFPGPAMRRMGKGQLVLHTVLGIAVMLLIAAPWYVLEFQVHGWPLIDLFFGLGNRRFFDTAFHAPGNPSVGQTLSIVLLALLALVPWTGFAWPATRRALRALSVQRHAWADRGGMRGDAVDSRTPAALGGDLLMVVWLALAFLLPAVISWRIIRYLIPLVPPMAILIARYVKPLWDSVDGGSGTGADGDGPAARQRGVYVAALLSVPVVAALTIGAVIVYAGQFPEELELFMPLVKPFLVVFLVTVAVFIGLALTRRSRQAIIALIVGSLAAYAVVLVSVKPQVETIVPWKPVAAVVNAHARPGERVAFLANHDPWFLDYYVDRFVYVGEASTFASWWQAGESIIGVAYHERDVEKLVSQYPELPVKVLHREAMGPVVFRIEGAER